MTLTTRERRAVGEGLAEAGDALVGVHEHVDLLAACPPVQGEGGVIGLRGMASGTASMAVIFMVRLRSRAARTARGG